MEMEPYNNFKFEKSLNYIFVTLIPKNKVVASISRIFSRVSLVGLYVYGKGIG